MSAWVAVLGAYGALCVGYLLGHTLGYAKGRREAWAVAQHFHSNDVARVQKMCADMERMVEEL